MFFNSFLVFVRGREIYLPIRQFFYNLIHPEYSAVTDVYVLMFLADTVDFIIIVFGFWAFGVFQIFQSFYKKNLLISLNS